MTGSANLATAACVAAAVMFPYACISAHASPSRAPPTLAAAQQKLAGMSVPFVPNAGQWEAHAAFGAKTFAGTLFVTTEGQLVYGLPASNCHSKDARRQATAVACAAATAQTLTESFITPEGKPLPATPHGYRPAESKVSYFLGSDESKHQTNVNTYERVNLGDVFPGINVQLRATGSNVEKIFTVAPHENPALIRVKVDGANTLEIGAKGELIAHTDNGLVTYTAPIAFQEDANGTKTPVDVHYALIQRTDDHASGHTAYAFTLGAYDQSRALTIDPLLQSTYLGGAGYDFAHAVAIHPHSGDVYVTGSAASGSTNFPALAGGADISYNGGNYDVFVSRFSGDLKRLIQSTLIGGAGDDDARAITIHPASGDVYVAGVTTSTAGFPGLSGAPQSTHGGGIDGFVSRLSADLRTLYRSSYVGGSGDDFAKALAIHPATGAVYVAGGTLSPDFPGALLGAQPTYGGSPDFQYGDGFVSAFSADLGTRLQSTFLGGANDDEATALAIHPATGEVYVAGWTSSANFPIGSGVHAQAALNGGEDAFVVRLAADLRSVQGGTFFGTGGTDEATGLAIHPISGDVVVVGSSIPSGAPLPGLTNAPQPTGGGFDDAFAARLSRDLSTALQSTYLGGSGTDQAFGVAIHAVSGEIFVTGNTQSANFPAVAGGIQATAPGGLYDTFVTRLSGDLRQRLQSTYLGTAGIDEATGIAIHPATGDVIVVGYSDTNASPIFAASPPTVLNGTATALTYGGGFDVFVARLSSDLTAVNRTPNPVSFISQSNVPPNTTRTSNEVQLIITPTPPDNQQTAYVTGAPSSQICVTNTAGCCGDLVAACPGGGFTTGWFAGSWQFLSGDRVAVRHTSANPSGTAETKLIVSGVATPFRSSTGNASIACNLDMNADNFLSATKEGLILLRAMLGFTGAAVVNGTGVTQGAWDAIRPQINANCGTSF